jgi:hypothetical protein
MDTTGWVTFAGDLILTATLVVFMIQARSMTRSTRSSVYQTVADQMMSIDRLFVERPELRPYFYGSKPPPEDGVERERVAAATELFIDFMDNVATQAPHMPEYLSGPWKKYFHEIASKSPSIRAFWRDNHGWYDDSMQRILNPVCLIDEQETRIPETPVIGEEKKRPSAAQDADDLAGHR